MVEHEGRCDGGLDADCPICAGNVSDKFIERMKAAAAQPGKVMTAEEFSAWLDSLNTGAPDTQ